MRTTWAALLVLAAIGCGGPRYCGPCREIRDLQAKAGKRDEDYRRLEKLEEEYVQRVKSLTTFHDGIPPGDLHTDCDCPCHTRIR